MIALSATLTAGCNGARPATAPVVSWSEDGEPLTTIEVVDHTTWPFALDRVQLVLDGEPILDEVVTPGLKRYELPLEGVAAGDHALGISITARFASTEMDGSDACAVRWRHVQSFGVGDAPVGVRIVAETPNVMRRFRDRLRVAVDTAGAVDDGSVVCVAPHRELLGDAALCSDREPLPFSDEALSLPQGAPTPWPF